MTDELRAAIRFPQKHFGIQELHQHLLQQNRARDYHQSGVPEPQCPNCHRPVNEGNSPNKHECHETNDDEGVCDAYALIHAQSEYIKYLTEACEKTAGYLHVHNWKWPQDMLDRGDMLRARIAKLQK